MKTTARLTKDPRSARSEPHAMESPTPVTNAALIARSLTSLVLNENGLIIALGGEGGAYVTL